MNEIKEGSLCNIQGHVKRKRSLPIHFEKDDFCSDKPIFPISPLISVPFTLPFLKKLCLTIRINKRINFNFPRGGALKKSTDASESSKDSS